MAARTYENFDLLLETEEEDSYRARVTSCPLGECPTTVFRLPFDGTQLENLLLKLDPGRSGTRRAAADPQTQAAFDFGGPLFEAVFADDLMIAWTRSLDVTRQRDRGLRLRLRLTDAPALAGLPWELLYDRRGNSFIAQSERTPLVRYLEVPQQPRPLVVDGPLHILAVIASPTDLPELDVDGEWARLEKALSARLRQGTVRLDRLAAPTVSALAGWLRQHEVHILHFIGHGDYDERLEDGVVYFCDAYSRSVEVTPAILGPHLRDHDPLRLVLLNACHSARVGTTDPYSGMAQGLVQQDSTAVVAMQFPISDGAAAAFTGEFYGALADGLPVDQAATSARKGLLADYAAEWATPVLFLRSPDGRVFESVTAAPVPAPTPPVERAEPAAPPDRAEPAARNEQRAASVGTGPAAPGSASPPIYPPPNSGRRPPSQPVPAAYAPVYTPPPGYPPAAGYAPPLPPVLPPPQGTPVRRRRRWRRVVAKFAAVLVAVFVALAWYGSTLPGPGVPPPRPVPAGLREPVVTAARLSNPPRLDGNPGEWTGLPSYLSDTVVAPPGASGTVRAEWVLGWDTDRLYFYVDVTDAALTQTQAADVSQLWRGDSVSFELGPANSEGGGARLDSRDLHVLVGPAPNGGLLGGLNVAGGRSFRAGSLIAGGQGVTRLTGQGYAIEASIPWSTLKVSRPAPGLALAANLNVSDAVSSGPRTGELADMVSNNPRRTGNDSSTRDQWGTLLLQG